MEIILFNNGKLNSFSLELTFILQCSMFRKLENFENNILISTIVELGLKYTRSNLRYKKSNH